MGPIFLFIIGWALSASAQNQKPITVDMNNIPKTNPVAGEDKTRLLKVDYFFETESVLYDVIDNKVDAPSTIYSGNFSFETLHYDTQGAVLARFTLTNCISGPCGDVTPVYVSFIQGGNNIEAVFVDKSVTPQWNFLFGIINTIYTPAENGMGDEQNVATIYGSCRVQFGRPEDKKFRRKINNCNLNSQKGFNFTRIEGLQLVDYSQDVWYIQNAKVDADIAIIDAIELLSLRVPFDEKFGFQLESRTHVEIRNRTRLYVDRVCSNEETTADCAARAYGAKKVGDKLYENVLIGLEKKEQKSLTSLVSSYRDHLHDMGATHTCELHSKLFGDILRAGRTASRDEWSSIIKTAENEPVLPLLGNVLGSLGSSESLSIAREILLVEGAEFTDDYLFGAAHETTHDEKWHKQMMYWLADAAKEKDQSLYWRIANTISTILRRRCEKTTSSWNACNKDKEKIVTKFVDDISKCGDDFCHQKALETLLNLPITASYQVAKKFLCGSHSSAVQTAALRLIRQTSHHFYDSQLISLLIRVFRNTCPQQTSTGESQLAIDVLVKCIPDHQSAATLLLRTEKMFPKDQEKWAYFYKAVDAANLKDELKAEFWLKMRHFKIFKPNYGHRAIIADSNAHWDELQEVAGFHLQQQASSEFDDGIFRRSEFEIGAKRGKKYHGLFGLSISTAGMDGFVREGAPASLEPEATVRLSLVGHALPTTTVFKGNSDMMAAVWSADGQSIKAFEGNIPLREVSLSFPLLSGASVDFSSHAAATVTLIASCEVSLWNRDSVTEVNANISLAFSSAVSMVHHGEAVRTQSSVLSTVTSIGSRTEAVFQELPFHFCLTMDRKPAVVSFSSVISSGSSPSVVSNSRRIHPAVTIRMDDVTTNQCNRHNQIHNKAH